MPQAQTWEQEGFYKINRCGPDFGHNFNDWTCTGLYANVIILRNIRGQFVDRFSLVIAKKYLTINRLYSFSVPFAKVRCFLDVNKPIFVKKD